MWRGCDSALPIDGVCVRVVTMRTPPGTMANNFEGITVTTDEDGYVMPPAVHDYLHVDGAASE